MACCKPAGIKERFDFARLTMSDFLNLVEIPVWDLRTISSGDSLAMMRKSDGTELRLGGEYREIVEPEKLVFTHAWYDDNGNPGPETIIHLAKATFARAVCSAVAVFTF